MGRKKKLIINEKSAQSDTETKEKHCKHQNKSIRPNSLKATQIQLRKDTCKDCRGKPKIAADAVSKEESELALSVCICLKCGYQGCSRNSLKQHAHEHFHQKSGHTICVNTTTWVVWCYACDNEIMITDENSPLSKAVKMIRTRLSQATNEETGQMSSISGVVKGLQNLGNTCFFNSVLQNISQTGFLVDRLDSLSKLEDAMTIQNTKSPQVELKIKKTTPLGPLTSALKCFLDEFHSTSKSHIVPSKLLGEITKKSPQFRGYRQQDSQELLRYLLDGMRTEELKRTELAMKETVKALESPPTKEQLRDCFNNVKTFVDEVFGGSLVSTIICSQCKTKSQVYDNFLDLSLPVNGGPKETVKSAAARLSNSAMKNEGGKNSNEDEEQHERKLSKHQLKVKAKKEKKAKRGKGKMSHSPKASKNGSTDGDKADAKQDTQDGDDDDYDDDGEVSQDEASKSIQEDQDLRNQSSKTKNGSKISIESGDSSDAYSMKEIEAGYVVIDRTQVNEGDAGHGTKQAILGGSSCKSQNLIERSSLESLSLGETSSLASTRSLSSKEDVSMDEGSPKKEKIGRDEEVPVITTEEAGSDNAKIEERVEGSISRKEEDGNINVGICSIIQKLDTVLKIEEECGEELESEMNLQSQDETMHAAGEEVKKEMQLKDHHYEQIMKKDPESLKELNDVLGSEIDKATQDLNVQENENKIDMTIQEKVTCSQTNQEVLQEKKQESTSDVENVHEGDNNMKVGRVKCDEGMSEDRETGSTREKYDDVVMRSPSEVKTDSCKVSQEENKDNDGDDSDDDEETEVCSTETEDNDRENEKDVETVQPEYQCKPGECSILSCLHQFTRKENLEGSNKYLCSECTKIQNRNNASAKVTPVFTEATKQMLLWKPPAILTLHLKRFEQVGRGSRKVNKHIEFPLQLNLSPFSQKNDAVSRDDLQYTLYGIVEHSGSLHGGHYVAYVKTRTSDDKTKWYYISDSRVSEIQEESVLRKQAYILFYHQN